jgi:hypothetical protein
VSAADSGAVVLAVAAVVRASRSPRPAKRWRSGEIMGETPEVKMS